MILLYVYKKNRELKRQAEVTNQVKAIGNIGDWVYCSDTDVLTMSTLASDIIGLSGKATIGFDDLLKQVCRDDEEDFRMVWNKFIETGSLNHDLRIGELNSYNWINIRASKDLESSKNKYIGYFTDITEKMELETNIRLLATVFDVSAQAIVITDTAGTIKAVNPAFTNITGYLASEAIGENPRVLKSGVHDDDFYQDMWQSLLNDGFWEGGELWNRKKDGSVYLEWNTITAIKDSAGHITEFVAQFSDIAGRKMTDEEIRIKKSNYDSLTGLANRSLFFSQLEQLYKVTDRLSDNLFVIFIELDNFKKN